MAKDKINMIFDATILANGVCKNAARSGIFFAALNIFKQFINRDDLNIVLYCTEFSYSSLLQFLSDNFPDRDFKIYPDIPQDPVRRYYDYLKSLKGKAKQDKNVVFKFILQFVLLLYSPLVKIIYFVKKIFSLKAIQEIKDYDVFFSPIFKVPFVFRHFKNMKKCVILYDTTPMILKDYKYANSRKSCFLQLLKTINSNDYYFAISNNSKTDFLNLCPQIDEKKIVTTLLACDERFKEDNSRISQVKKKYNIPENTKYVFSLCNLAKHKNLIRIIKTTIDFIQKNNIDDFVYVLGGGNFDSFLTQIEQKIDNLGKYKDKIIRAGYIDDEDLPALYSGAEWFVYTSQYEGFGLPPLEAMSCGCPVITSNNSSLPEVVGNAGIMIDWDSDEQHVEAYEKYYYNEDLRKEYAQKGLERAKTFSWAKCTDTIIERLNNVR